MKILVTGGAGFIGSNFVHYMLKQHPGYRLVVLDKLTYAGNLKNIECALGARCDFVHLDICAPGVYDVMRGCDAVVHFAAESHVDRSIENAAAFVRTNFEGTFNLLEAARRLRVRRYIQISTDEVYGSLGPDGVFTEESPIRPNSPYAASKAAADLLAMAYVHTHRLPAIVTRCSNNYGAYQFPEKFIPLMIAQAMAGERLPVYGDGLNVRDWVHVEDHCRAIDLILHRGREGQVYNIGGGCELKNLEVARMILAALGRPEDLIQYVKDRPGHDRRYAMSYAKLQRELGWTPQWSFQEGLANTIRWYRQNSEWLDAVRSGQYRAYFETHYINREITFAA
jgi:dTDP-glucose 4,6-dehydratase